MKRILRISGGVFFCVLGFAGLFLPMIQGILFLILGCIMLAPDSKLIKSALSHLKEKYPALFEKAQRFISL